jgi:hypothetical protein
MRAGTGTGGRRKSKASGIGDLVGSGTGWRPAGRQRGAEVFARPRKLLGCSRLAVGVRDREPATTTRRARG